MGSVQDQLEKEIDLLRRQLQDEIHHSQRLKLTVDRLTKEAQANQLAPGEGLRDHRTWRGEAVDGEASGVGLPQTVLPPTREDEAELDQFAADLSRKLRGQADEPAREDEWPDVRKRTLLPDWHNWTEQVERRYDGLLAEVRMIVDGLHDEIGDIDKRLRAIVDCVTDWMPRSDQRLDEVEKQVEDLTARADLGKMTDAAQGAALANHSGRLDALEATVKRHEIHITEQARLIAELRRQMRAQSAIIEEVCEDHGPRLDALEARLLNAEKMVFTGNTAEKHQLAYGTD